ncbi:MAG: HEAT repeat domain-containing protein [Limisphaerales bacterium]
MRRAYWIGIALLIGVAITAAVLLRPHEPEYQGRTLSSWLQQATEPARHVKKITEARMAIRAMDTQEVIPVLLRLAGATDRQRSFHSLLLDLARQFNIYVGPAYQSDEPGDMAIAGFQALGTNAASAVPTLAEIAKEPQHAMVAFRCLSCIGPPASTVICDALTNSDATIRSFAVSSLPDVVTNRADAVDLVRARLNDADPEVRTTAIQVLGTQLRAAATALPLLVDVVQRGNTNDATVAATQLGNFTTNAIPAFETLSNAAYQSPHSQLALASLRSMLQISPERTLPILSRRLHSVDPWTRAQALMLLIREYPTPGDVVPALEYAAQDPEEFIAIRAEDFLEGLKQSQPTPHPTSK